MKLKLTIAVIFTAIFLLGTSSYAQWKNIGPEGGMVKDVVSINSTMLCLTPGGLYRSVDNGNNWTYSNTNLPYVEMATIIVHNNKFFVSTGNGIYSSLDGQAWTLVSNNQVRLIYSRGPYLFGISYAVQSGKILRSLDDGSTWVTGTGAYTVSIGASIASIDTVLYAGTTSGVWYSTSNGAGWQYLGSTLSGTGIGNVTDIKSIASGLLISTSSGIYKHTGSVTDILFSASGAGIPQGLTLGKLGVLNNKYLLVTSNATTASPFNVLYTSADGANWNLDNSNYSTSAIFNIRYVNNTAYLCSSKGIFTSTDNGNIWAKSMSGINAQVIQDLKSGNNKLYAVVGNIFPTNGYNINYGGGIYTSSDDGINWVMLSLADTLSVEKVFISDNQIIALVSQTNTFGTGNKLIYKSLDGGTTWGLISGYTNYLSSVYYANNTLYIPSALSMDKSTDFGDTWQAISMSGIPGASSVTIDAVGSTLFASTSLYINFSGGVFKSIDGGSSWIAANNGFNSNMIVGKIKTIGSSLFAFQSNFTFGIASAIHRSVNMAQNWAPIGTALPQQLLNDIYGNNGSLFLSTGLLINGSPSQITGLDSGFVFESNDNGTTWNNISDDLPSVSIGNMTVSNSKLFVSTSGHSVWSKNISSSGVDNLKTEKVVIAYPNPAKTTLTIISPAIYAKVEILSLTGIIQETVLKGNEIDISGLAAGTYLIKLFSSTGVTMQKFVKE